MYYNSKSYKDIQRAVSRIDMERDNPLAIDWESVNLKRVIADSTPLGIDILCSSQNFYSILKWRYPWGKKVMLLANGLQGRWFYIHDYYFGVN